MTSVAADIGYGVIAVIAVTVLFLLACMVYSLIREALRRGTFDAAVDLPERSHVRLVRDDEVA
jgi:hypothetical protein